jgi:hypothetical protein
MIADCSEKPRIINQSFPESNYSRIIKKKLEFARELGLHPAIRAT